MIVSKHNGFTLVELVTVVVLIGIVTAVAGPRFFNMEAFQTRGYADELASSLRYAQRIAIASNCNVRFRITAGGYDAFHRNVQATCRTGSAWNRPVRRADGVVLAGVRPNGVAATPAIFQFSNTGALVVPTSPAVAVGQFFVTVDPVSGLVSVQ